MNGTEKCSRGNVIVSALTRFLKIGKHANVKRKVSDLIAYYSSAVEGSDNPKSKMFYRPLSTDGNSIFDRFFVVHGN
jgi:hypothetical protein